MIIRPARVEAASAICSILRRSITELCTADHGSDPAVLDPWLASKVPETVAGWIVRADHHAFVAVENDAILGVAAVTDGGEVTLNYVSPDADGAPGIGGAWIRQ